MGLIKAISNAATTALGDQFKEFVTCPTIDKNVAIQRGIVKHGEGNTNPSEGVITNGSAIAVPQGMAMMIIDNGEIKEFTAEAGTFYYDTSSEPSIFTGNLGDALLESIKTIGKRFTYGGQTARDQRVYYVNTLAITDNKFGSPSPRQIFDVKYQMLDVTFFGTYSFQVTDPITLVNSVIGANAKDTITFDEIVGGQLKSAFIDKFTQAVSSVMTKKNVSFGFINNYNTEIAAEINTVLDTDWKKQFGLEIITVNIDAINLTEDSRKKVDQIDSDMRYSDPSMQAGLMAAATAEAMKNASSNSGGAMMGFMGMNMAQAAGVNMMGATQGAPSLYNPNPNPQPVEPTPAAQPAEAPVAPETPAAPVEAAVAPETPAAPAESTPATQPTAAPTEAAPVAPEAPATKTCPNCGTVCTGNFCSQCGTKLE